MLSCAKMLENSPAAGDFAPDPSTCSPDLGLPLSKIGLTYATCIHVFHQFLLPNQKIPRLWIYYDTGSQRWWWQTGAIFKKFNSVILTSIVLVFVCCFFSVLAFVQANFPHLCVHVTF